jgi:hypothetical protein
VSKAGQLATASYVTNMEIYFYAVRPLRLNIVDHCMLTWLTIIIIYHGRQIIILSLEVESWELGPKVTFVLKMNLH